MVSLLDGVEEYNNQGALIGIDGFGDTEVKRALDQLNPVAKQKAINMLANNGAPSRGSRAEMEKYFKELPQHIKDGLLRGELRLADTVIYSIKAANSKTIKIFEPQDDKDIGLRNISNAKLPKNQALLVSGIYLLAGVSADATKDKVVATEYKGVEAFNAISTGEFSLKSNRKYIVPETSNMVFKTNSLHMVPLGYYKLANPRLIHDDILIEMTLELGSLDGIAANTNIYVGLHGTMTTP